MRVIVEDKVVTIRKAILLTAAAGTAIAVGNAIDWHRAGSPVLPEAMPPARMTLGHATPTDRCGGATVTDGIELQRPLPNAYMTVNGRVFSLADLVRCGTRLHSARLS